MILGDGVVGVMSVRGVARSSSASMVGAMSVRGVSGSGCASVVLAREGVKRSAYGDGGIEDGLSE